MLKKRTYHLTQKERFVPPNCYQIPSVGLLKGWKFDKTTLRFPPILKIGEVLLDFKRLGTSDPYSFDVSDIRRYLQDTLPDDTMAENEYMKLVGLNSFIFGKQIEAIQWYQDVDNDLFFQTIFTREFPLYFLLSPVETKDVSIPVEEEYVERVPPKTDDRK